MHIAILSGGDGWHVRDLAARRQATPTHHGRRRLSPHQRDHCRRPRSASRIRRRHRPHHAAWLTGASRLSHGCAAPLASRRQTRAESAAGAEVCIDKYLASARLEAAGLRVPPTITCQDADSAMKAFAVLGGDVVVKPLFGSEGRGMVRVTIPKSPGGHLEHWNARKRCFTAAVHSPSRMGRARLS